MKLRYALALAAAATAATLATHAQEGGPPGSEAPDEMEGKVETVIVIGETYRCPDGTMVGDVTACPAYVSFRNSFLLGVYDQVEHIIRREFVASAPTCGATVDANCECGDQKVKVYDKRNDEFHCYDEPPPGCPKWDQTFDFDLNVWACVTRPLDAVAEDAANRIKACFSTASTIHKFWNNVQRFEYGTACPPGKLACVISCSSGGTSNVVQFNEAELNKVRLDNKGNPIDATEWQWFAEALNHDLRHVRHNAKYGCGPWNNLNFWVDEQVPSWVQRDRGGEEIHAAVKSLEEYEAELGVKSPYDQGYKPANDKQLPNCRLW